jgi:phosphohistidine phosphatase
MKLILARHGEAEHFSESGRDRDRKLTKEGRDDIRKVGRFIKLSSLRVKHIYHSPYERTKETAEIFSEELGLTSVLVPCEELAPENECENLLVRIKDYTNSDTILIVSHNPGISHFAAQLIQGDHLFPSLPFLPGTTLALNVPREYFQRGQIMWMISPHDLNSELFLNTHS